MKRRQLFLFGALVAFSATTIFAQGQFQGRYEGMIYVKSIINGNETQELPQGPFALSIDNVGNVSADLVEVFGTVDGDGAIAFEENGFGFQAGQVTNDKIAATGSLVNGPVETVYRLDLTLVPNQPIINLHPQSATVVAGANVQFSVSVIDGDGYQWQKDGIDIPGTTLHRLNLNNVGLSDAGVYRVRVNSTEPYVWSNPATLTVIEAGENPSWKGRQFVKVATTETTRPGVSGTFAHFGNAVLTARGVYFASTDNVSNSGGIYRWSNQGLEMLVDTNTAFPSSVLGGSFSEFQVSFGPDAASDDLVIWGKSTTFEQGVFRASDVQTFRTIATSSGAQNITPQRSIGSSGDSVYFTANDATGATLYKETDGVLSVIYNTIADGIPGRGDLSAFGVTLVDVDGTSYVVTLSGSPSYWGCFASFDGGPLTKILDTDDQDPSQTFDVSAFNSAQVDGEWVYVSARGASSSTEHFIMRSNGTTQEIIVAPEERVGGVGSGRYRSQIAFDADGGRLYFSASIYPKNIIGIYEWSESGITPVVTNEDRFDGRAPGFGGFEGWNDCVRGDQMVFLVNYVSSPLEGGLFTNATLDPGVQPGGPTVSGVFVNRPDGPQFEVQFELQAGKQYRVQYASDFDIWENAATILDGDLGATTWVDSGPPETLAITSNSRFYRLIEVSGN